MRVATPEAQPMRVNKNWSLIATEAGFLTMDTLDTGKTISLKSRLLDYVTGCGVPLSVL